MAKAPKATKGAGAKVAAAGLASLLGAGRANPFSGLPGQVRLNEQAMRPTPFVPPKRKGRKR